MLDWCQTRPDPVSQRVYRGPVEVLLHVYGSSRVDRQRPADMPVAAYFRTAIVPAGPTFSSCMCIPNASPHGIRSNRVYR